MRRAQLEIDSKEFAEWIAFNTINPGDPERGDMNTAQVCSLLANIHRGKGEKPYELSDFRLQFGDTEPVRKSTRELKTKLLMWRGMHKTINTKNKKRKCVK